MFIIILMIIIIMIYHKKEIMLEKQKKKYQKISLTLKYQGLQYYYFFTLVLVQKFSIKIGRNNTFKDAAIKFCQSLDLPTSVIGTHLIFLNNASKLDPFNDKVTIEQMGLKDNYIITVIDYHPIIGA